MAITQRQGAVGWRKTSAHCVDQLVLHQVERKGVLNKTRDTKAPAMPPCEIDSL